MKLVIVSGLSGAGKTVALKQYEDLGYYCIDNIPLALLGVMMGRVLDGDMQGRYEQLAFGIDARESPEEIERFPSYVGSLRAQGVDVRVLFLSASDEVLLRRYSETRRRHPLSARSSLSLFDAIHAERRLLAPVANLADVVLDTSHMNLHELREAIHVQLPEADRGRLIVQFMSFGFKNGLPDGCDYLFDVRCLPNPHWDLSLRPLTGLHPVVGQWLQQQPDVGAMLADLTGFLERWLPAFRAQDRAYVTIAVGCTGGQHRSPYIVERLGEHFGGRFDHVFCKHRDI